MSGNYWLDGKGGWGWGSRGKDGHNWKMSAESLDGSDYMHVRPRGRYE